MATSLVDGPPVVPGSLWRWTLPIEFDQQVVPLAAALQSTVRTYINAPDPPIVVLTSNNGGIRAIDAGGKTMVTMEIDHTHTHGLSSQKVVADLWRMDLAEPVYLGVLATVPVQQVTTRL